ncbi:hypothetical protein ASG87_16960 [Frateuria sp. Soil773]|uniref:cysteine hydrolase family protein n=1 Tax=Frateuria sp. Soil773 TaxID=1736407 RepID=UPI000700C07B|nr:isochorismatase family cysteine hydrolase [Frateuria sp. Soil773]KRE94970.1 hypothetical protein ASG87_16960 [Frateuria sp. Soil773]
MIDTADRAACAAPNPPGRSALIIMDMINTLDFEGGEALLEQATPITRQIARLRHRYRANQCPVIYANSNFGDWHADFAQVIGRCRRSGSRGARLSDELVPDARDYFVLKPSHSAFYQTPLVVLLETLQVDAITLVGIAGDECVLHTALDAQMRVYPLWVPVDGVASLTFERNERALACMNEVAGADISPIDARASAAQPRTGDTP